MVAHILPMGERTRDQAELRRIFLLSVRRRVDAVNEGRWRQE